MNYCKGCKRRIQWARHRRSGTWMIFDTEKKAVQSANELRWIIEDGNWYEEGSVSSCPIARRAEVGQVGVLDHHATCPKVDEWRNQTRS